MNNKSSVPEDESSEKRHSIKISNSILQRLETGVVCEKQDTEADKTWIKKLASVDQEHTRAKGLDLNEVDQLICDVSKYTTPKSDHTCIFDTIQVTECMKNNKGNTTICEQEVQDFKKCINKLMYDAVREDVKESRSNKKESYMEAFEREYQL